MTQLNEWYSSFLAKRSIPLQREVPANSITEGFAINISKLHLTKLNSEAKYRVAGYFFDSTTSQLFGSSYNSQWRTPEHHECLIDDELFFHCPRIDESILLILEIVEQFSEKPTDLQTVAWGMLSIGSVNTPIPSYGKQPEGIQPNRLKLHPGTPKVLLFSTNFDPDATSSGIIEYTLYSHPDLLEAADYFPDFCILGKNDVVPGLVHEEHVPQLSNPRPSPVVPSSLDDIGVSFGPHANRIEQMILEDVNTERLYSENHAPGVGTQPMQVIERRLRIGVHNGYTFLFEPIVVHLSLLDEQLSGNHSIRRKGRPLSRSSTDIRSELNTLFVRSRVSIPRLTDDNRMTIVLALDYLLGIKNKQNNLSSNTRSLIVCWGAWKPFSERSILNEKGRVQATVSLIGGARPNPEESLCYKNLLHLYRRDDSIFTESAPKITIQFNFSLDNVLPLDSRPSTGRGILYDERDTITPAPRREEIRKEIERQKEKEKEEREERRREAEKQRESGRNVEEKEEVDNGKLPPIPQKKSIMKPPSSFGEIDKMIEKREEIMESPRENVASIHEIPWKEARVTNVSRSAHAAIANTKLPPILDRHGDVPVLVDGTSTALPDMSIENNDRLDSNEVVMQLIAIKTMNRPESVETQKVFFTTQFFRFPELTTEQLLLSDNNNNSEPNILRRLDRNGKEITDEAAGFTAKFIIDRQCCNTSEGGEFLQYLLWNSMIIQVWDASSLILLGVVMVPLRCLLRKGCEAVQCVLQCPVVSTALPQQKTTVAILYLKLANIGHPSSNQIDLVNSRTSALVSRRLKRLGEEGPDSYRILAKPLNSIHENALQRFMHAQRLDIQQRYETMFNEDSHERMKEWQQLKTKIPNISQKETFKKFIFDEQLEAYRKVRNESKASKLLQAVFQGISLQHRIFVSLGERQFFEYLLQNTYSDPINCVIEIDEPGLSIVNDFEEWEFYKKQNNLSTPLEKNMFQIGKEGHIEVFLKPMESIYVPFLYEDLKSSKYKEGQTTQSKVLFRRWDNGDAVSILDLHVEHLPPCINQTIRIYSEQGKQCSRIIGISGIKKDRRIGAVKCNDPTVKISVRNRGTEQELHANIFTGLAGSSRSVLVMLYADIYCYRLLATWKIVVHSLERIDVRSSVGQSTKFTLTLNRKEESNQLVQLFSSNPSIRCAIQQPSLITNQIVQLPMIFTPKTTGHRFEVVTVVDCTSQSLLHAFLISTKTDLPNITNRFEMRIEIGLDEIVAKKLSVSNPYSIPRLFRISSSRPELVTVGNDVIEIEGNQSEAVTLYFQNVVRQPLNVEILIFVQNMETGQTEETFALHVTYYEL